MPSRCRTQHISRCRHGTSGLSATRIQTLRGASCSSPIFAQFSGMKIVTSIVSPCPHIERITSADITIGLTSVSCHASARNHHSSMLRTHKTQSTAPRSARLPRLGRLALHGWMVCMFNDRAHHRAQSPTCGT